MNRKLLLLLAATAGIGLAAPAIAQPPPPWVSINQREANLNDRIDAGLRSGALTMAEAADLRTRLRALEQLEAGYRASGGGLDIGERTDLDRRFDALSAGIRTQATDNQNAGNWASIPQRKANLDARIDAGVRSGALTTGEAASLRMRYDAIARLEDSYRASGGLDARERAELDRQFDQLSASIRTQATDNQTVGNWTSIPQRKANLDARIDAGVRSGALTQGEAASLRMRFDAIARLEATYRASGGLDARERDDLDRQFDQLSASIRTQANDGQTAGNWTSIPQRKANLDARIDAGVRSGALTRNEAATLRTRFDSIVRLEATYRASGGLDARERAELDRQFDQLSASIRTQATDNQRAPQWNLPGWNGGSWVIGGRWQTIEQRQGDFNRIIEPRVQSGRISRQEAAYLRGEFTRILNLEHRYQAGGLSSGERAEIDRQFNVLVARIRAEATDGNNGRGLGGRR